jgi:hypothetical protein
MRDRRLQQVNKKSSLPNYTNGRSPIAKASIERVRPTKVNKNATGHIYIYTEKHTETHKQKHRLINGYRCGVWFAVNIDILPIDLRSRS